MVAYLYIEVGLLIDEEEIFISSKNNHSQGKVVKRGFGLQNILQNCNRVLLPKTDDIHLLLPQ
jgi:hypothetical protein